MYVCSFGLAADQKRSRFKEGGRSMNSTGSGKSSTVSRSVHPAGARLAARWLQVDRDAAGSDTESC